MCKIVYNQTNKGYNIDWFQLENVCYASFHGSAGKESGYKHVHCAPICPCASNKLLFGVESVLAVWNEYKKTYTYSSKNGTEDRE